MLGAFFRTDLGLAVRATGENEAMIRSLGVDTDKTKIVGLALSNGFIALSGALVAQNHGFADIGMGIGILVTGAAAVLIGEAIFGDRTIGWWIVAALTGVVIYRLLVALALRVGMQPIDLRFVTAVLLLLALGPAAPAPALFRLSGAMLSLDAVTKSFLAGTPNAVMALDGLTSTSPRAISSRSSARTAPANRPCSKASPAWSCPTPAASRSTAATSPATPVYQRAAIIGRIAQDPHESTCAAMTIEENLAMAAKRGRPRGLQPSRDRGGARGVPRAPWRPSASASKAGSPRASARSPAASARRWPCSWRPWPARACYCSTSIWRASTPRPARSSWR